MQWHPIQLLPKMINLIIDPVENPLISKQKYNDQVIEMYQWHFKKNEQPCTFDELVTYCKWLGLKEKQPTKDQVVNFLLDKRVAF